MWNNRHVLDMANSQFYEDDGMSLEFDGSSTEQEDQLS
jgi:hypothetical protein